MRGVQWVVGRWVGEGVGVKERKVQRKIEFKTICRMKVKRPFQLQRHTPLLVSSNHVFQPRVAHARGCRMHSAPVQTYEFKPPFEVYSEFVQYSKSVVEFCAIQ